MWGSATNPGSLRSRHLLAGPLTGCRGTRALSTLMLQRGWSILEIRAFRPAVIGMRWDELARGWASPGSPGQCPTLQFVRHSADLLFRTTTPITITFRRMRHLAQRSI